MAKIESSREIAAPPQVVFDYFDNHANTKEYFPYFSDLEWTTPTHEVGTHLKMVNKSAGLSIPMVAETTAVEPGRRIAGVFSEGIKGTWEWLFSPTEKGTLVISRLEYELPLGLLGQIADRLVVERDNEADLQRTLDIVQEKTESQSLNVETRETTAQ